MRIDEITPGSLPDAALRDAAERLQKERRRANAWRGVAFVLGGTILYILFFLANR